jgi:hypothetical protein
MEAAAGNDVLIQMENEVAENQFTLTFRVNSVLKEYGTKYRT